MVVGRPNSFAEHYVNGQRTIRRRIRAAVDAVAAEYAFLCRTHTQATNTLTTPPYERRDNQQPDRRERDAI